MKKTTQSEIAEWLDVSDATISEVKSDKHNFGPATANRISIQTGIKVGLVLFGTGEVIYEALLKAYRKDKKLPTDERIGRPPK